MRTDRSLPYGGSPSHRPPGQRPPWTENILDRDLPGHRTSWDRDLPGQRSPGQRSPWTETPWTETPPPHVNREPLDTNPLDRDPPGQRLPWTEIPLWTETPWIQIPWTETPLDRLPWTEIPLWTETPWTQTPSTETPTQRSTWTETLPEQRPPSPGQRPPSPGQRPSLTETPRTETTLLVMWPVTHSGTETPLWTESQTGVKTLPCPKLRLQAIEIQEKGNVVIYPGVSNSVSGFLSLSL